jgi:hypothetical protein
MHTALFIFACQIYCHVFSDYTLDLDWLLDLLKFYTTRDYSLQISATLLSYPRVH